MCCLSAFIRFMSVKIECFGCPCNHARRASFFDILRRSDVEGAERVARDVVGSLREVVYCGVGCGGARAGETRIGKGSCNIKTR